jgi:hypothetical protein
VVSLKGNGNTNLSIDTNFDPGVEVEFFT